MTRASSPGKLILTGEHAVLFGCPALAAACTPRVACEAHTSRSAPKPPPAPASDPEPHLTVHIQGRPPRRFPESSLASMLSLPRDGAPPPRHPEELLAAAALSANPEWRGRLDYHTLLPVGSGMGASAAFLLATLKAVGPELSPEDLYDRAKALEDVQHGGSSGLDVWTSLHGGAWWVRERSRIRLPRYAPPEFRLFHSGVPESTTGECVRHVRDRFFVHDPVWRAFTETAEETRAALESEDADRWSSAIRKNHRLLCEIGVVPDAVRRDITDLEANGGAAKLCGAGSIRGDAAGIILARDLPPGWNPETWIPLESKISLEGVRPETNTPYLRAQA